MGEIKIMVSSDKELYIYLKEKELLSYFYFPISQLQQHLMEGDKVDLEVQINKYGLIQKSYLTDLNAKSVFKASPSQDC